MPTRFRLFAQPPFGDGSSEPEVVEVSSPAGSVAAGPTDASMYVVEPNGKDRPYGLSHGPRGTPFLSLPPWRGPTVDGARPDANGHFDHLLPGDPGFNAAHAFGSVRFTLDVWERYLGHPVSWHFAEDYRRLEISMLPQWDNAQYGYGFLELGSQFDLEGRVLPFANDFDVIAHEIGHAIIYSVLGVPMRGTERPEYVGFQESFADCVSLVAAMHFPSVIEDVLQETSGNLHRTNRLSRFSEFSATRQIRSADNTATLADFVDGYRDEHELSQPLTGAIFDIVVDVFHDFLVDSGAITAELGELADDAEDDDSLRGIVQDGFDEAFARQPDLFRLAMVEARDTMGWLLADTLHALRPDYLDYGEVAQAMAWVDRREGGALQDTLRWNFERRFIGELHAGPHIGRPDWHADRRRNRRLVPQDAKHFRPMRYRERHELARQMRSAGVTKPALRR